MVCIVRAEDQGEMLWKARGEEGAEEPVGPEFESRIGHLPVSWFSGLLLPPESPGLLAR